MPTNEGGHDQVVVTAFVLCWVRDGTAGDGARCPTRRLGWMGE